MSAGTVKAEALGQPVDVEFDGTTYTVPTAAEWDLEVLEAYEDGRIVAAIRALLGAEQWATFRAQPRTVADLTRLFEVIQAALGLPGN